MPKFIIKLIGDNQYVCWWNSESQALVNSPNSATRYDSEVDAEAAIIPPYPLSLEVQELDA